MRGKIIKGIGGFYYVPVPRLGILECRAKGIFRNQKVKPLVGDDVEVEVLDEGKKVGSITQIYPRRSQLIRPAVANVEQAVIVFALSFPKPNLNLLDRFLLHIAMEKLPAVICFNKTDDAPEDEIRHIVGTYENSGYRVLLTSAVTGEGKRVAGASLSTSVTRYHKRKKRHNESADMSLSLMARSFFCCKVIISSISG